MSIPSLLAAVSLVALLPTSPTADVTPSLPGSPIAVSMPAADRPAAPSTWEIDATHSELTFRVRHLVSRVRGSFRVWKGTIVADADNWATGTIDVTIDASSITTNSERRDTHLRSPDFFDVAAYPTLRFVSTRIERSGETARIHGNLTIRGVTKPVVLEGELMGIAPAAGGKRRVGFEASTTINRMDYGVAWNRGAEGGGVVLGDEVQVTMVIAAVEK